MQSCQTSNLSKKDKRTLYIHTRYIHTSIPAYSSLEISSEHAKSFSFEAVISSNVNIEMLVEGNELRIENDHQYFFHVVEGKSVVFTNSSDLTSPIKLRIFNHSTKVIQTREKLSK